MSLVPVEEESQGRNLPPYVPYRTFRNFIEGLRAIGGTPGRIDRSLMATMSGAIQGQLLASLRYLGLVTPNGTPTDALTKLVESEGPAQKTVMRDLLTRSYPFLFATTDFNPRKATSSQLTAVFTATGAQGETVRKCIAFLLLAAEDAEMPLSPYFKAPRAPRGTGARPRRAPQPASRRQSERASVKLPITVPASNDAPRSWAPDQASLPKEIQGALAQLPPSDAALTSEEIEDLVTVYRIALKRAYLGREA